MIVLSVVDLPAPFRPTRQTTSRAPTSSETARRMWLAWMKTSISRTLSIVECSAGPRAPASAGPRAPADHGVDDALVRLDGRMRAVGQDPALVEGDDAIGVGEDDVHVVLDLDDGLEPDAPGRRHQRFHDRGLVRGAHARRRLVEQDDLGPQRERRRDVEQLLVALRQVSGEGVEFVAQAKQLGDLERLALHVAVARERREQSGAAPEPGDDGGLQGLEHREVREDVDQLERAGHAEPSEPHRPEPVDLLLLEAHRAGAGRREPGQDVDQRGLAGAVGADDRDELAGGDAEAHPVEGAELAVELPEPLGDQDHVRDASIVYSRTAARRGVRSPRSPPGAKMTMAARIAPKISRQYGTTDITQCWR